MMKTKVYDAPLTRVIEVRALGVLLTSTRTVEQMNSVTGSWDEEEE